MTGVYQRLPIALIDDHPANVRSSIDDDDPQMMELVASIRQHGVLQPVGVYRFGQRYRLLRGHRRKRAAFLAGLETLPCMVVDKPATMAEALEKMLVENIQRKSLDPLEESEAFIALCNTGMTQIEIARKIGKSDYYVSQRIAFSYLTPQEQAALRRGDVGLVEAYDVAAPRRAAAQGRPTDVKANRGWTLPHFTTEHPQAQVAKAFCDESQHNNRRRIGPACPACWEAAIRADQEATRAPLVILERAS